MECGRCFHHRATARPNITVAVNTTNGLVIAGVKRFTTDYNCGRVSIAKPAACKSNIAPGNSPTPLTKPTTSPRLDKVAHAHGHRPAYHYAGYTGHINYFDHKDTPALEISEERKQGTIRNQSDRRDWRGYSSRKTCILAGKFDLFSDKPGWVFTSVIPISFRNFSTGSNSRFIADVL